MARKAQVSRLDILILDIFVTDQVQQGLMSIEYCPTDEMVADFMSKPLQGEKFRKFRKEIMNL